jgi:hypothetical protein
MIGIASIGMKVLGWLTGGVADKLLNAYQMKLNAKNDKERIQADILIETLEKQRDVLIAEQGHWITKWIRPAFAFPFVVYVNKIVIWDKVLGWGTTDDLSPEQWQLMGIVFGAYFLSRPVEKWLRKR